MIFQETAVNLKRRWTIPTRSDWQRRSSWLGNGELPNLFCSHCQLQTRWNPAAQIGRLTINSEWAAMWYKRFSGPLRR